MRISTLAGLLILTTAVLSTAACTQTNLAAVVDHSNRTYGWNGVTTSSVSTYAALTSIPDQEVGNRAAYSMASMPNAPLGTEQAAFVEPEAIETRELAAPQADPIANAMPMAQSEPPVSDVFATTQPGMLRWPVQGNVIRTYGVDKSGVKSEGIQIATPYGMPIRAADDGEVAYVGNNLSDFGNMTIIRHTDGSMTSYAHASEVIVKKGDKIQRGALLGYVGRSGNVAEPQLGFTMRVGSQTVDPLKHLPQQFAAR
jgi:murein DD-endopeptidase MepM/ murein hydrolase activator NlpD